MLNRKESIKKSLGISEYPWSSDDEEPDNAQAMSRCRSDLVMMHRRTEQSRPSVGDTPGTSNQQSSTTTTSSPQEARRAQAKADRDLFWSMLNTNHRSNLFRSGGSTSRVEIPGMKHSPAAEMRAANDICDVQRMIFHRTRRIPECRSSRSALSLPSPGHQSSSSVARDYSSHNFMASQRLAAAMLRSRSSRRQRPEGSEPTPVTNEELQSSGSSRQRSSPTNEEPTEAVEQISIDHSDDEPDLRRASSPRSPSLLTNAPRVETPEAPGNNTSAMSLEEEVMEIEAEPAMSSEPPAASDAPTAGNEQSTNENKSATEINQPHGVKRKRDGIEENEFSSVKEFNQSILRLLECPVCLEWMEPPMSQCRRGHLVCARCRGRLALCPVCRTAFSSVRNRAMEGVAEMLRYPCRHGCGREVRLRRRTPHEASCAARRYRCPACRAPPAAPHPAHPPHSAQREVTLPLHELAAHFQSKHMSQVKLSKKLKFSVKVNVEQHDTWLIMAMRELFHLQIDVDLRVGIVAHVAYIGPMCKANNFVYEVTVCGQHNSRKLVYSRGTHSDLESTSINIGRQDCFHLSVDQALNFLRVKNRHCETDKFLNFTVEISQTEENGEESDF